jgi:DNA polymerase-3 subunit delta
MYQECMDRKAMRREKDLSYQDVRREVQSGRLRHAYYLRGDEDFLKKNLAEVIVKAAVDDRTRDFNYHLADAGDLEPGSFASTLCTPPMIYGKRLFHVRDANKLSTKAKEIAASFASKPPPEVILLMVDPRKSQDVPPSDRRSKLLKAVSGGGGAVVTCWKLFESDLMKWVVEAFRRRDLAINDETVRFFVEVVGEDLMRLNAEVEKLATYASGQKNVQQSDIEQVTGRYRQDTVFELMHLASEGKISEAVDVLENLRRVGEPPVRILYWLSRHYMELGRLILERTQRDRRAYFEGRGRRPRGVVDRHLSEAALHDERSVRDSLSMIYDADVSIKRDGDRADNVLEHLVVNLSMRSRERREH